MNSVVKLVRPIRRQGVQNRRLLAIVVEKATTFEFIPSLKLLPIISVDQHVGTPLIPSSYMVCSPRPDVSQYSGLPQINFITFQKSQSQMLQRSTITLQRL